VERNALRAGLVDRAEAWRWGSLYRWKHGTAKERSLLASWPLSRSPGWLEYVNTPQTESELTALRRSVSRGCPFGDSSWTRRTASQLGLESSLRSQGRPRKPKNGS
jgi:putative transposase